ncbi:DUF726 domain-containing protein [Nocardioides limicola]|uniref:DUF726 domain-containing protein n=1 Tax=Nocardioides limicola TaxID=2803368 RepID=UPI00193B402F|nr:DUF726 domain-containing protein [Nocardioides sp. DJM-14]
MSKVSIVARVIDGNRIECRVVSAQGPELTLTGSVDDQDPEINGQGDPAFVENRALASNAWAYATFTHKSVSLPDREQQTAAAKRAKAHETVAKWIAEVASDVTTESRHGWCSACFGEHSHRKAKRPAGQLPSYLCVGCGSPTLPCAGPTCKNMAVRGRGGVRTPRYCAEHRHEIPGFSKASQTIGDLSNYREFLEFEKRNLSGTSKLVGLGLSGLLMATPAALAAAPAIGGAVGTVIGGYTGAAATNFGLALLGGGAVSAGGFGMLGGTLVIGALGGALGGTLGASITNTYVREDKSFHIEMLRGGPGTAVIVCSGFLSQNGKGWGEWRELINRRYPDSPVYRVHWGAKELKNLGLLGGSGAAKFVGGAAFKRAAARAAKVAAKRIGPIAPALMALDLAHNPWHVAKSRSEKTGLIVADLLARTDEKSYVLIGHSLGARAMVVAAQALSSKSGGPRLEAAHLLGAAIGAKSDWFTLTAAVDEAVYNYHSTNDRVLKMLYTVAQGGQTAAGLKGFTPIEDKLQNIDVSEQVKGHSDYFENVILR